MKTDRRVFLSMLGSLAIPSLATAADSRATRWLHTLFNTDPALPPPFKPNPSSWSRDHITLSWLGHSTVLIDFFGTMILTDPLLMERAGMNISGLFTLGPKRVVAPALTIDELPPIDLILISHAHMDHCDKETLRRLKSSTPILMPANTASVLDDLGFARVEELKWHDTKSVGGVTIEALPVNHKGARFPWDRDHVKDESGGEYSSAYVISARGVSILFCGDTAYTNAFASLAGREIPVTLAILPIGGYIPHHDNHCTPEEALTMADEMRAKFILPIHWGTLPGEEPLMEPIERLKKGIGEDTKRIALDVIGATFVLPVK